MACRPFSAIALLGLVCGCPAREVECRSGADCASGACRADGTCAGQDGGDGGLASDAGESDAGLDGGTDADAGTDAGSSDGGSTDGGPLTCSPNYDGTITRAEMPMGAGLHATFRVAANTAVSTLGSAQADGGRSWDLSGSLSGDHAVLVETQALEGKWFQAKFSSASYAAPLSDTQDLLGVFEVTPTALLLRGVVSPAGGTFRTELEYDPPAKLLSFPLSKGDGYQSTSTVSGVASGVIAAYSEEYSSTVDQAGELKTPFGQFPVLRVAVHLTRSSITYKRQHLFVTECFGTVATIVSQDYESSVDFTNAAEVRRLSP